MAVSEVVRVADICLMSRDVEKRTRFYEDLGLSVTLDQGGLKCLPLGDKELAIHREVSGEPVGPGISLLVDDLESLIGNLKSKGIKFNGPSESHMGTSAIKVEDPEGFWLEIHQLKRENPQQARFFK